MIKDKSRHKASASVVAQPRQEDALFSPVAVPRWGWNKWSNSTPQKDKNPADDGGKEGEEGELTIEWTDEHSLYGELICVSSDHWEMRQLKTVIFF